MGKFWKTVGVFTLVSAMISLILTLEKLAFCENVEEVSSMENGISVFFYWFFEFLTPLLWAYVFYLLLKVLYKQIRVLIGAKFRTVRRREVKRHVVLKRLNEGREEDVKCIYYVEGLISENRYMLVDVKVGKNNLEFETTWKSWVPVHEICDPVSKTFAEPKEGKCVTAVKLGKVWLFFPDNICPIEQVVIFRRNLVKEILFNVLMLMLAIFTCWTIVS